MEQKILLDEGSGGRASQRLINTIFLNAFHNNILDRMDDAAALPQIDGPMAMSTDSYTVSPLFFPGASIGSLAVNGTVNDVSMLGAKPLYLTCAFILEEGLPLATLQRVVEDMVSAADESRVKIVTGDTKVVPAGACDKMFINTTGLGQIFMKPAPSGHAARPGDVILVSGAVGDHGIAVFTARENLSFASSVKSDCAPLADLVAKVAAVAPAVHVLRDPTRGGLATTLNEIAEQSGVCVELNEDDLPVHAEVADACSFLGLDPLYLANEGKCICILPPEHAEDVLRAMRNHPHGREAAIIGRVTDAQPGKVILHTAIGGSRFLGMLEGAQLPRIC